jgi:hypothetical protein
MSYPNLVELLTDLRLRFYSTLGEDPLQAPQTQSWNYADGSMRLTFRRLFVFTLCNTALVIRQIGCARHPLAAIFV